jgi:gamma-glutamylcyclotransferase (GGCT)/AIG2-like uncharacterized protein YtfP
MHRIFVYGTLKRGLLNHALIASSRFLGPAATTERFRMIANGFPVLLSHPDGLAVVGELYEVDTETREQLDHLERVREGGGGSYQRRATDVHYIGTVKGLLQAWLSYTSAILAAGTRRLGRNGTSPIASDNSNGRGQRHELSAVDRQTSERSPAGNAFDRFTLPGAMAMFAYWGHRSSAGNGPLRRLY